MTTTEPKRGRDESLDWVKGALVVLMIAYHSLNYSVYASVAFVYIAFLPPSFIFLAGFLLTHSYLARYDLTDWRLHRRLITRGAKLLFLFTALNLSLYLLAMGPAGVERFAEISQFIYLAPSKRLASFTILTSIGYLLLLAPLLLRLGAWNRWVLPALAFASLMFCSALEWKSTVGYHLGMISAGIVGTAFGLLPQTRVTAFAKNWFIVLLLYGLYRACGYFIGEQYAVQLTGVVTGLLLLYSVALKLPTNSEIFKQIVLLGRYSLFGYIIQLGTIQIIVRLLGPFRTPIAVFILTLVTLAATWAMTLIVDRLRAKARFIDLTYKTAFA